jgi:hypothetical protein
VTAPGSAGVHLFFEAIEKFVASFAELLAGRS